MMKLVKGLVFVVVLVALYLALWPVPVDPVAWDAPVDRGLVAPFTENDRLGVATAIELGEFEGPEDVAIGFDGRLYSGTKDGKVISFNADGSDLQVFADTGGRPLGIEFAGSYLYVANSFIGLQRIRKDGRVVTLTDEFEGKAIAYADDVAVAKDGSVYFSDASSKFDAEEWSGTYSASLLDILEHGGHGKILKYDPFSDATTLIMDGLNFANGVAISDDQSYLLINETGSYQVHRYWLLGPMAGTSEVVIDNLPGFPDNINSGLDGRFWIGLVAPRSAVVDRFSDSPFMRKLIQRLPAAIRPKAIPSTHLIAIDGDGNVLMNLQDTQARFPAITGALETEDQLFLSSLFGYRIGRVNKQDLD
jgi:sugar lactone lactonase YvrE